MFNYGIKYLKIQQEIMKNADKAHYRGIPRWLLIDYDRRPETVGVSDGRFIAFITKDYFYLNENVFMGKAFNGNTVIKYYSPDDGYPVFDSGELINAVNHTNNKKHIMLHKFRINEKQENIYIDDEILTKYFDLSEPVQLRATGKKEPLYIWNEYTLVGLILPVNHPEGGEES